MLRYNKTALYAAAILTSAVTAVPVNAAIIISEVAPWSSGNSPLGKDWFELTNTGSSAVNISGWKMDDNSNSFGSSVALNNITSIGAGQSVVFVETASDLDLDAFKSLWFGSSVPAGFAIGRYNGSGVGLGTGGDAVNIFDASGNLQTGVTFGASPAGPSFPTFDNAAGLSGAISQLSVVGVNGAFAAIGDANEIGSPGAIAAPVPVPAAAWLMLSALGGLATLRRRA
jgi:hypothetical protein